jgi:pimeloyl-ACP methyl ester carboxylesterase
MAPFLGENGFRVYCPDMPSFGLTADPDGAYAYGEAGHVDFLQDFANGMCLERFHLAGNSMGCANTAYYLVTHPERVTSFAMIAGGIGDVAQRPAGAASAQNRPIVPSFDGTPESMRKALEVILFNKETLDDDVVAMRTYSANHQRESYERFRDAWLAGLRGEGDVNQAVRLRTRARLDCLTIPGIYLHGRQDALSPLESAYAQEDMLERVQFFYPDETGHQGQTDRPDLFNQVFLEFFQSGRVSAETAAAAGISTRRAPNPSLVEVAQSSEGAT